MAERIPNCGKKIQLPKGNGKTTQEAMEWVKSLAIKGGKPVPVDEDGKCSDDVADDAPETTKQKAYVKETLYRALDEAKRAQRGEVKLKTLDEFIEELEYQDYFTIKNQRLKNLFSDFEPLIFY